MDYIILISALVLEVVGTSILKFSNGFSNFYIGCLSYLFYGISIYMFSVALKTIHLAVADTIWQGLGIVLICLVSNVFFREPISPLQYLFILITMSGVIGLGLVS